MTFQLTVAEYRLIAIQLEKVRNATAQSSDEDIQQIVRDLATHELTTKIPQLKHAPEVINTFEAVSTRLESELFLKNVKKYVVPFKKISEKALQKLFSKEKKLRLPKLERINWQALSYLSWYDPTTHRKYIVMHKGKDIIGLRGTMSPQYATKGVCAICHKHRSVNLFTSIVKRQAEAFTSYSNYICTDSDLCNLHIDDENHLYDFVIRNLK